MKHLLSILCVVLFLIFSCSKQSTKKVKDAVYERDSLSFILPPGWNVIKDTIMNENKVRFLELNKYAHYKVENTIGITIYNQNLNPDSLLNKQIDQTAEAYRSVIFKILDRNKKSKLGKFDMLYTSYEGNDYQTQIYGRMGVVQDQGKVITIQMIERDSIIDSSDYNLIFDSFTLKKS